MNPKTASTPQRRSSTIVALVCCCVAAVGTTSAHAQQLSSSDCAQHTVINGIHHQPTVADIAAANAVCGVASSVDTAPELGRAVDEINNSLLGAPRD